VEDFDGDLAQLPVGQRRVALALIDGEDAPTYAQVAQRLGLHLGTVHTHLRRIRQQHPDIYAALMQHRRQQLAHRHQAAVRRARLRLRTSRPPSAKAMLRHYRKTGRWPWERPG